SRKDPRPSLIDCKTVIGQGAPNKAGSHKVHGAPLGADEIAATRAALGWTHEAFTLPKEVYTAWHAVAARGREAREGWEARLLCAEHGGAFEKSLAGPDKAAMAEAITAYKQQLSADAPKVATRKASEMALAVVNATLPNAIGGSADLTGSNLTLTKGMSPVSKDNYGGNYIHYGIREFGMSAAMNGIALHGGL
ncbi:transketolase, partial [Rhodovulum sulfidophilum]|nr:transketolase [Rhodovulum sulfidophilum]